MMNLSDTERSALMLRHFEGHSIKEIAQILDLTTNACKQTVFRAVKTDAASQFQLVIETKSEQSEAALYWKAYAYYKAGRKNEAERELRKLERAYPQSRWIKEGRTLRVEYQDSDRSIEQVATDGSVMDEELRLFALSQLMERDPERALPLVLDLMNTATSQQVRNDAMFVLGISEQPAARQALAEAARNSNDPELQIDAIHMLGTLDASSELQSLYPSLQSSEARVALIEALSILESLTLMDDAEGLALKILRTETDPELKRQAIQVLGIMDSESASAYLLELYPGGSRDEKAAIVESMMIMENTQGLLSLLEQEDDPELKRQMISGFDHGRRTCFDSMQCQRLPV
jgi:tetratricopeptide (TPR) repeat protein